MRKLVANLNDGSFINIPADKMTIEENLIIAKNGEDIAAVIDTAVVLVAYISDKGLPK